MTKEERAECMQEQIYQHRRCGIPVFIPPDGMCPFCGKDIYAEGGISYMAAHKGPELHCPFCGERFSAVWLKQE